MLTVCTANICRSATAERSLRTAFDGNGLGDLIEVTSAGVAAIPGAPMCPEAAELLDAPTPPGASPHASRRLTAELVTGADLVLTADRGHLGAAGALAPGRRARLYTLRQAATLLEWVIGGSGVLDIARLRAAGGAPDLDPLDPLVQVPALPESLDDQLAWLLDELDAARGTAPVVSVALARITARDRAKSSSLRTEPTSRSRPWRVARSAPRLSVFTSSQSTTCGASAGQTAASSQDATFSARRCVFSAFRIALRSSGSISAPWRRIAEATEAAILPASRLLVVASAVWPFQSGIELSMRTTLMPAATALSSAGATVGSTGVMAMPWTPCATSIAMS